MKVEWADPKKNVTRLPGNQVYAALRDELRKHVGRWAVIRRDASSATGGQFRTSKAWADFEIAQRLEDGKYVVYARFMGKP